MHEALKLFQVFAPQGAKQCGNPQKIAVKLQVKDERPADGNAIDFDSLLASLLPGPLLHANPGKGDSPLENLDWLALDQSLMDQSTPVIDLTNPEADNEAALQMLVTLALNMSIPNGMADMENKTHPDHPAFPGLLQSAIQTTEDASETLMHADLQNTEGTLVNGRTVPDLKAILPEGEQKGLHEMPAGLGQKMDVSQGNAAEALDAEGEGPSFSIKNSGNHPKRGRSEPEESSLIGLKSSKNHPQKAMPNMAEPSMAPSGARSGEAEKDQKSFKHTLLSQNRIQGDSSPGQESAPKFERSQDTQDFRPTALHGTRDQTVMPSRTEKEPAQLPRDMQTDVIRQIVARMTLRGDSGRPEMQIKLKPEFLGDLRLHITTENQHVMVRITADSPAVKEMIEQNLQFLKSELQQHGLQIDKFDVFVGQENEAWKHRQQQNASHDARRGRQRFPGQRKLDALEEAEAPQLSGQMRKPSQIGMKEVDFFA